MVCIDAGGCFRVAVFCPSVFFAVDIFLGQGKEKGGSYFRLFGMGRCSVPGGRIFLFFPVQLYYILCSQYGAGADLCDYNQTGAEQKTFGNTLGRIAGIDAEHPDYTDLFLSEPNTI